MVGNWWGNERAGRYRFGAAARVCHAESNALAHIFFNFVPRYQNTSTHTAAFFNRLCYFNIIPLCGFYFIFEKALAKANSRMHEKRR
jgi:hypothetical protein